MRFGFVTCVQLGLSCMDAIYASGGRLNLAVTLVDDQAKAKSGRVYLDKFCEEHCIDLLKVRNINHSVVINAVQEHDLDWLFIIGWSQIARSEILNAPRRGVLGMHPTLLPIGRGRAAIPWAILKQLDRTGVTLFKLDEGVDTGPILGRREIPLRADIDANELYRAVNECHVDLIRDVFPALEADTVTALPQDNALATEWPGRTPADGAIDRSGSVFDAERLVRATTRPYPGAFVEIGGKCLTVWRAEIVAGSFTDSNADHAQPTIHFHDGSLRCVEWEERTS